MTTILRDVERKPRLKPWLASLKLLEKMRNAAAVLLPPLITIGFLL